MGCIPSDKEKNGKEVGREKEIKVNRKKGERRKREQRCRKGDREGG